jgi:apoptosis-inducing factor 2
MVDNLHDQVVRAASDVASHLRIGNKYNGRISVLSCSSPLEPAVLSVLCKRSAYKTTMLDSAILLTRLSLSLGYHSSGLLASYFNKTIHGYTYKAVPDARNVVVIGASYAGYSTAYELASTLPTGWRVILIEKNDHFHFTWVLPRFSVLSGQEHKVFVPYDNAFQGLPEGSCIFRKDEVVRVTKDTVVLKGGDMIPYEYLVFATGANAAAPSRLNGNTREEGIAILQDIQEQIHKAQNLVVVGGGAAGVELATDAKAQYPDKHVTLVHSRDRLMHDYGPKLHEAVMKAADEMKLEVILGDRVAPEVEDGRAYLTLSDRHIPCDYMVNTFIRSLPRPAYTH